jgi:hypothetical protein
MLRTAVVLFSMFALNGLVFETASANTSATASTAIVSTVDGAAACCPTPPPPPTPPAR